jgi:dolichol-phosphate mannosyltransferase
VNPETTNFLATDTGAATLSVVVPCYNEEEVIELTHERLTKVISGYLDSFEIIYVDDGSRDRTREILTRLSVSDKHVRMISFSRNFGHQIAVSAGVEQASGQAVVIIDADLQDPPEVIGEMLSKWADGADVVYAVRAHREGEGMFKQATAFAFYRILSRLSDVKIPLDTGDFRLMDRRVVDTLNSMPERDRFVRGMVSWVGFRQEPVHYRREPRAAGATKYPLSKMIRFAVTGVLSFSTSPLRLATWIGFSAAAVALAGVLYGLYSKLILQNAVPGWAATFTALMLMSGVQLITLGIIGEYLSRVFVQTKGRPLYVTQERLGFPGEAVAPPLRPRVQFKKARASL